ncbi:MAG TPA: hypothetical protein VFZ21_31540 [Gemmatimonadaceae bacterium]|nr:hypothetical protein [Gemmatimonadaceae bacterium]
MPSIDVLFVCPHGAAKSVIAAEYCRRAAAERGVQLEAASAGVDPYDEIPENVVVGLASEGIDVSRHKPVRLRDAILAGSCRIIAIGCDIHAPEGITVTRWDEVPAVSDGFDAAREVIASNVAALVDEIASSRAAQE